MNNAVLNSRDLRNDATVSLDELREMEEFRTCGQTLTAFSVPDETEIEFPEPRYFAAWIRDFRGSKIPYISGLMATDEAEWLEIPASIFRPNVIAEDENIIFDRENTFGALLRAKDRDLDRWEMLAGKRIRLKEVMVRVPGFDKESKKIILDPKLCQYKKLYKIIVLK